MSSFSLLGSICVECTGEGGSLGIFLKLVFRREHAELLGLLYQALPLHLADVEGGPVWSSAQGYLFLAAFLLFPQKSLYPT